MDGKTPKAESPYVGNFDASAAIAALQADVRNVCREVGQLREGNAALLEKVSASVVNTERLAAETKALNQVGREEIQKLFELDSKRSSQISELSVQQSKLVLRSEHQELAKDVSAMNAKLAKVIMVTGAVAGIASALVNSLFGQAIKSLFK